MKTQPRFSIHALSPLVLVAGLLVGGCGGDDPSSSSPEGEEGSGSDLARIGEDCDDHEDCWEGLKCEFGVCAVSDCLAGETGCYCADDEESTCLSAADECVGEYCMPTDCDAGDENCECESGACGAGLYCLSGEICVDSAGYLGGNCLTNGLCNSGFACDSWLDRCVACQPGEEGCQCDEGSVCDEGLQCGGSVCTVATGVIPDNPVCYSPCTDDSLDGSLQCDSDGLTEGCLDGYECASGSSSCVVEGEDAPSCEDDFGCTDYQTCLSGHCYSNCVNDTDCPSGLGCDRKVCRVACQTDAAEPCADRYVCQAQDGQNGYCHPLQETDDEAEQLEVEATISLNRNSFSMTNVTARGTIEITVNSDFDQELTISKVGHSISWNSPRVTEGVEFDGSCEGTSCPLWWLAIDGTTDQSTTVTVEAGVPLELEVAVDQLVDARYWDGRFEISAANMGTHDVHVSFAEEEDGRWAGTMTYFGNFGTNGIDDLNTDPDNVGNALLKRWSAFKTAKLDGWDEFNAVLAATSEGAWEFDNVQEDCASAACYLYVPGSGSSATSGLRAYVSSDLSQTPIPSGAIEFPFAMDLYRDGVGTLHGKVASDIALHYPGNPPVSFALSGDISDSGSATSVSNDSLYFVDTFSVTTSIGGRTVPTNGSCDGTGFETYRMPWLVPGFELGVSADEFGNEYRIECRDSSAPLSGIGDDVASHNLALANANPVLDGKSRNRTLELLDGALINQDELFILFKETMDPLFESGEDSGDPIVAYGYLRLRKALSELADEDENKIPDAFEDETDSLPLNSSDAGIDMLECDPDLLGGLTDPNEQIVRLVTGVADGTSEPIPTDESIYYLCHDTGRFSGSPATGVFEDCEPPDLSDEGVSQSDVDAYFSDNPQCDVSGSYCEPGSVVTYFALQSGLSETAVRTNVTGHPCRDDGTCGQVLEGWIANYAGGATPLREDQWEPSWTCATITVEGDDFTPSHCDGDRLDLRNGKNFFFDNGVDSAQAFPSLRQAIESAFRYKTRFKSRSGASLGFAPDICDTGSEAIQYCYDPGEIEELLQRIDCLLSIYRDNSDGNLTEFAMLKEYLTENFGVETVTVDSNRTDLSTPITYEGFEKLYAELLIMLGDEALSKAHSSRFDLAGTAGLAFPGSEFEPDGVQLTGVAGFELYSVYQAAQYYQMVLDRFYRGTDPMWLSLKSGEGSDRNFISQETVFYHLDRVIHASTQLAQAWEEAAKQYQSLNRADLAALVLERAYVRTYHESNILSALIKEVAAQSAPDEQAALQAMIGQSQRRYGAALLGMREVYDSLTDDLTYFGFAPDYVPFPALDPSLSSTNAFDALLSTVTNKLSLAATREQMAIESDRSLAMDSARFQSELTGIRNTYESQLAEICGNFVGDDGSVYPATARYAYLSSEYASLVDPCGLTGNGSLASAVTDIQTQALNLEEAVDALEKVADLVEIEAARAAEQCDAISSAADLMMVVGEERNTVQRKVRQLERAKAIADRASAGVSQIAGATYVWGGVVTAIAWAATEAVHTGADQTILRLQKGLEEDELQLEVELKEGECQSVQIDALARIREQLRATISAEIAVSRAQLAVSNSVGEAARLANEAKRLSAQQEEAEALLVDVEAARNDPNVRIYRNDAVINADIAFDDAIKYMYRLTRVFEYYTSQSYSRRDELFLTRMVSRGTYSLENYLLGLTDAFYEFEEEYGNPDERVMVLSLRDDILKVPHTDQNNAALTQDARLKLFRGQLSNSKWLNEDGYLSFPFSTTIERVSPLTRNHKILYLESQIFGSSVGDKVGRVYVQQSGTGIVHSVDEETGYFRFPDRTAVVNPFFSSRVYDTSVYRNYRLRDLPLLNSTWSLILNMRDEYENQDIDLNGVDDIWIYIVYSDFTDY